MRMQLSIQSIPSFLADDFSAQLRECIGQIKHCEGEIVATFQIVKITVFSSCLNHNDYLLKMNLLDRILAKYDWCKAPVSLVSQPPLNCETMMEVWMINFPGMEHSFTFSRDEQASVLHIDCPDFSCLFSTLYSAKHKNVTENAREAYKLLDSSLRKVDFDYSKIVRQWNYIEAITEPETINDSQLKNYQVFNDLRSIFYENSTFANGYPSATGIGIANGGCTIEVIALKEKTAGSHVKPVTNSLQVDAHNYSSAVLTENAVEENREFSTPKFERGKYMQLGEDGFLFISGTASIMGEITVFSDDVAMQTLTTLQIIDSLISVNNLNNSNINLMSPPGLINYRVYLKRESDYAVVKSLCEAHFGIKNGIFYRQIYAEVTFW